MFFDARLNEGRFKDINNFQSCEKIYGIIAEHGSLKPSRKPAANLNHTLRPNDRIWYNLLQICSKYGEVNASYGMGKKSILAYTRAHRDDVIAVITRNTEYFIYDVDFDFWSLSDLRLDTLKIAKFCRKTLNEMHGLSYQQMQLMHAISKVKRLKGNFLDTVEYIKRHNGSQLTANRQKFDEQLSEVKETASFSGEWSADIHDLVLEETIKNDAEFRTVLRFFKEKIPFAYKLVCEEVSGPADILFIDIRAEDSNKFIDLVITVTRKLIGIVFKDQAINFRPATRTMRTKHGYGQKAQQTEMDVLYPNCK